VTGVTVRALPGLRLDRATAAAVAAAAALCVAMGFRLGPSPVLPAFCYLAAVSVPLTIIDVREKRLPDVLTLPSYPAAALLLGLGAIFIPNGRWLFLHAIIGLAVAGAFYVLLAVIYPAGIGWGDVKLSGILGLYLGWCGARTFATGLIGGFVLAAVFGIALIVAGRASRKTQIPFGPFMLAGAVAAVLVLGA
jgi:leader peptidase (prepilin peptidase) / N-methyltransferase